MRIQARLQLRRVAAVGEGAAGVEVDDSDAEAKGPRERRALHVVRFDAHRLHLPDAELFNAHLAVGRPGHTQRRGNKREIGYD